MSPSTMLEIIKSRRVARRFHPERPVPEDALRRILEAATWAPYSVYHPQGWKFIALRAAERDRAVQIVLRDHTILKYIRYRYENALIGHDEEWKLRAQHFGRTLGEAPVLVVCFVKRDAHSDRQAHNLGAVWCAAQNMMLQATAEGVSSGVVSLGSPKVRATLTEHLGLDQDEWLPAYLLNLGYATDTPPPELRDERAIEIRG